jgi:hypothetical protein
MLRWNGPCPSHPWEEWETRIKDWQRTYYRKLFSFGGSQPVRGGTGLFWTIVRVDLEGVAESGEQAFNAWHDTRHIPDVRSHGLNADDRRSSCRG